MNRVAVLLTTHNRKDVTLQCLERLYNLTSLTDVFLVDDASDDGTYEAIMLKFPQVHLIKGNGNLYWCRGMNLAWKTASSYSKYDYYLWLNDDLLLYDNAFDELFKCSKLKEDKAIISGIIQGQQSKKAVYGGFDCNHHIISPTGRMEEITNLNGNFVLIPLFVFKQIGFFDNIFHHDIGDVDYGLSAREKGISVLSTRCFIGSTSESLIQRNSRIRKNGTNVIKRFKRMYSPLGCPPNIHFYFIKKHRGIIEAICYVIYLHFINILPDSIYHFLFKK